VENAFFYKKNKKTFINVYYNYARGYCDRACLLVVRYNRYDFSKSAGSIFMKFGTDVQSLRLILLLTLEGSRSTFKVICLENEWVCYFNAVGVFLFQSRSTCGSLAEIAFSDLFSN